MKYYKILYLGALLSIIVFGISILSQNADEYQNESIINLALRNAGHELLLSNNDSISLILPIKEINKNQFQLSFQSELSIVPDILKNSIKRNFDKANLVENYLVEVIDCSSNEINYSYMITPVEENNIVSCLGRELPANCYLVNVYFQNQASGMTTNQKSSLLFAFLFTLVGLTLQFREKKSTQGVSDTGLAYTVIGNYKFYKQQNQLVKEKVIIELTAKECELLDIFSEKQNQIVKRDLLIKKVWEDNGVIVGRSLDTYISKIRKKLKDDDSIKIVNIHGVGYKLEII